MTHTNCTHPATKAGRAACRKGRPMPTAIEAKAAQVEAPRLIKSISFETTTCDRCGGTAYMPFSAWGGVCLKCNKSGKGNGQMLTRAGKAAAKAFDDYIAAHHTKMMIDLQPGDMVRSVNGRHTVVEVDPTMMHNGTCTIGAGDNARTFSSIYITVRYAKFTEQVGPYVEAILQPRGDDMQAAFRHVANRKGVTVTYVD